MSVPISSLSFALIAVLSLVGDFPRLLGGLLGEVDDRVDDLLARVVREHHRAEHDLFGQLLGLGFDHHHRVAGGGDDEVELARG